MDPFLEKNRQGLSLNSNEMLLTPPEGLRLSGVYIIVQEAPLCPLGKCC